MILFKQNIFKKKKRRISVKKVVNSGSVFLHLVCFHFSFWHSVFDRLYILYYKFYGHNRDPVFLSDINNHTRNIFLGPMTTFDVYNGE